MKQLKTIGIQALLLRTFLPAVLLVAMALAILVYNLQYAVIMDGFDRKLMTTSAVTGAMIDPADHDWLMQEAQSTEDPVKLERTDRYLRNVEPMRHIRVKLGLTYLYTQALGGTQDIFYILDSSLGDEHSPIGSEDDLPEETMAGLHRTQMRGGVYISPVEYQKQWGLLKTAAAPVYGEEGEITSTAGADVNISVIQVATQNALFASAMIGLISILACLLVTLQIVRRIARPIEVLKQEALRIAAGDHTPPAQIIRPHEAMVLRNSLAAVTSRIVDASTERHKSVSLRQRKANEECLITSVGTEKPFVRLYDDRKLLIIWIPTAKDSAARVLANRSMVLLRDQIAKKPELMNDWELLADLEQGACMRLDREAQTIRAFGGSITLRIVGKDIILSKDEEINVDTVSRATLRVGDEEIEILENVTV